MSLEEDYEWSGRSRSRSGQSRSRSRSSFRSRSRSSSRGSRSSSAHPGSDDHLGQMLGDTTLCATHGNDLDVGSCKTCRVMAKVINPSLLKTRSNRPEMLGGIRRARAAAPGDAASGCVALPRGSAEDGTVEEELEPVSAQSSTMADRFGDRSDKVPPSLTLDPDTLAVAVKVFGAGLFEGKGHFEDIVKKHWFLAKEVNDMLEANLQLEPMFAKLEREKKFPYLFSFHSHLMKCVKHLRISQRPVFLAFKEQDLLRTKLRNHGAVLGMVYPPNPELKTFMGPKAVSDELSYHSAMPFPLPLLTDPLDGTSDVSSADAAKIKENHKNNVKAMEDFRDRVTNELLSLYNDSSDSVLKTECLLSNYFDMFGHVDASFLDIIRKKMVQMLKPELRPVLTGEDRRSRQDYKDYKGLFGGLSSGLFFMAFS